MMYYVQDEREFVDSCINAVKEFIEINDLHDFEIIVNNRHKEDFAAAGINLLRDKYDEPVGFESVETYIDIKSKIFDGKKILMVVILPDARYKRRFYRRGEEWAKRVAEEHAYGMLRYLPVVRKGLENLPLEYKELLIP